MIEFNKSNKYVAAALNSRALRQDLISSNISNVDTPYYRSKDVDFETILAKEAYEEFVGKKEPRLEMAKSSRMHMEPPPTVPENPTMFFRDGHMARNDGNTVDLDVEMSELSKNGVMFNALVEAMKKGKTITHSAIDAGKNL